MINDIIDSVRDAAAYDEHFQDGVVMDVSRSHGSHYHVQALSQPKN